MKLSYQVYEILIAKHLERHGNFFQSYEQTETPLWIRWFAATCLIVNVGWRATIKVCT